MKIIFYLPSMATAGGIERVFSQHIKFLVPEHKIFLITDDHQGSFYPIPENVKHISLNIDTELSLHQNKFRRILKISRSFSLNIKILRKEIQQINPDLVYTAHPLNLLKVILSFSRYEKIMVTEHASINGYNFVYRKIAAILYKKIKLLAVPTTLDSEFYLKRGISNEYLPNPLSFFPAESAKLERKIALNVGRFTDDKQHLLLLELWSKSDAAKNGWTLKIIGKGENYNSINAQIKDLKIEDSVVIQSPTKEIITEYLNCSLFLFTSRSEGFGLVLAEAMACGVPCISFNCPSGPRDIINNGSDGYLIDAGNHEDFIHKLNQLTANEDLRKKMGKNAKKSITKFSSEIINTKLNHLVNLHFKASS